MVFLLLITMFSAVPNVGLSVERCCLSVQYLASLEPATAMPQPYCIALVGNLSAIPPLPKIVTQNASLGLYSSLSFESLLFTQFLLQTM